MTERVAKLTAAVKNGNMKLWLAFKIAADEGWPDSEIEELEVGIHGNREYVKRTKYRRSVNKRGYLQVGLQNAGKLFEVDYSEPNKIVLRPVENQDG